MNTRKSIFFTQSLGRVQLGGKSEIFDFVDAPPQG